jgi:hypothetical protein
MREILRATWRRLETWCGSGPRATQARQPSTLLMSGDGKRALAIGPKLPRPSSTLPLWTSPTDVIKPIQNPPARRSAPRS